jgi:hypothetical protein
VQAFGNVAATSAAQAGGESAVLGTQELIGSRLMGTGSLGLADRFALESFNSGIVTTLAPQLNALNQFNLVSTLLG